MTKKKESEKKKSTFMDGDDWVEWSDPERRAWGGYSKKAHREMIRKMGMTEEEYEEKMDEFWSHRVRVLFEEPGFPVIIIGDYGIFTAQDLYSLADVIETYIEGRHRDINVRLIDLNGREFFYEIARSIVAPDWWCKKWNKREIIDLYNRQCRNPEDYYINEKLDRTRIREIVPVIAERIYRQKIKLLAHLPGFNREMLS